MAEKEATMKPAHFLRIASVLTLIHAVLHTAGGVFGKPSPGIATEVASVMRANHFPVFGVMRSYAEFYRGLGLGIAVFLVVEAIVFWQLGSLVQQNARQVRPILIVFALGYLGLAMNSYLYFFAPPVVVETLIAACLTGAALAVKPLTTGTHATAHS